MGIRASKADRAKVLELAGLPPEVAVRKYHNEPVVVEGVRFDSRHEASVWGQLKVLEKAGEITDLRRQVRLPLVICGVVVAVYVADFRFVHNGADRIADAKGVRTPVYRLKKKLVKVLYGQDIVEL